RRHQGGVRRLEPAPDRPERRAGTGARRHPRARALARRRPGALHGDGRRLSDHVRRRMRRRHRRRRRHLGIRRQGGEAGDRVDRRQGRLMGAARSPVRVGCLGMGWWSDVLADAIKRSGALEIAACYSRSQDKKDKFAAKYGCRAAASYEEMLADGKIDAIVNTTPNSVHLETTRAAAAAGKHVFLDKPIANTVADARALTKACRDAGVVLALGYQRRKESQFRWIRKQIDDGVFGRLVNAEANISRDRLGKIDLNSWRYQASGMPG